MRRQESTEANAISRDKSKKFNKDPLDCELTLDDLDHLISEKCYDSKHIAGVAKCLFKKHGMSFEEQFCVVNSVTQLEIFLEKSQPTKQSREPLFILFRNNQKQWVTITFVHSQHGVFALYKDSLGGYAPFDIKEVIKKRCTEATLKAHVGIEQEDGNSGGPMALKNVEINIESLVKDKDSLIDDFEKIKFCSSDDIQLVKGTFKEEVGKDIVETCSAIAEDIGKNSEFKQEMTKLVDSCVEYLELVPDVEEYTEAVQKEAEKQKENPDYVVNSDDIQVKRDKLLNNSKIKILSDQIDVNAIESSNKPVDFVTDLEKKYPDQFKKFKRLFKLLGVKGKKDLSERDGALWAVNEHLGISEAKTTKVYQALISFEPDDPKVVKPVQTKPEVVEPVGVDEINKQLEELAGKQVPVVDHEVKLLEQILAEIAVVEVKREGIVHQSVEQLRSFFKVQYEGNLEIGELEGKYRKVKESFREWKGKGVKEIAKWADNERGRLSRDKLCEAVAVMDRANELVTGGHLLRDTQILAILDILGSSGDQGRLCQIESGEGKTVIVSLLAAIKVLQGKQVDVITSNEVLAKEGVKNRNTFFGIFKISVAHNNQDELHTQGARKCYTADVVYGSMSSFQFDFLKDSFEGYGTRGKRRFDFVILDEVDSLLLDDGGHIAKLAEPFPGFDALKYVYIKIWQELVKAENELVREFEESLNEKLRMGGEEDLNEIKETDEFLMSELFLNQRERLVTKIKDSDPANIDLIPIHLRQFALDKIDVWIENAIHAKYFCHENEQYVVRCLQENDEPKIVPVDYQSTGVTLKNTMWSNGLHQFVQLKHNLHLTSESLTSSLISNIGYCKLYSSNIFGLTGTLGSTAEQELLSSVYNVGYSKIPTFKPRKLKEICGRVVKDDEFKKTIVQDVLKVINDNRSVLIICPTIKFGRSLEKKLKKIKHEGSPKMSTYFDEDTCDVVDKEIGVCEIIISTNIAGRGSDFKTSSELEENGGLHVFVCFLPVNQRVEDQAFGRTARQGKAGTAQIVMRESDALALGFAEGQEMEFNAIKKQRDYLEVLRLANIRDVQVTDIDFHDKIFERFSGLYRQIISLEVKTPRIRYLLRDLKEFWAFWLHKINPDEIAIKNVDKAFKRFTTEASLILGKQEGGKFEGGSITHNPYYSIQQAEYFMQKNLLNEAEESLRHAVQLGGENTELLYPAYIKIFELSLERGQVIMRRFIDFVKKVVPIDQNTTTDNDEYKRNAREALLLAKAGLEREITYIQINFTGSSSNDVQTDGHGHDDFLQILAPGSENILVKHIWSKLTFLHTHLEHVNSLLVQVEDSFQQNLDIALSSRVPNFWSASNNLTSGQTELREIIGDEEIRELSLRGLETMYTIRTIPDDLGIGLVRPGLVQIAIGATVFGTGVAFPPSFPIMAKIAEVFIIEGIMDIVIAIATLGESKFNFKNKLISYGTQALTIGVFALVKYTQIAQKVINVCKKMITFLEKCPYFEEVCVKIVSALRTVVTLLEHEIAAQSAYQSCSMVITAVGKSAGKTAALTFIQYIVCEQNIDKITERSRPQIVEYASNIVKRTINRGEFNYVSKEYVLEHLTLVLQQSSNNIFKDATRMVVEKVNAWVKSSDYPNAIRLQSDSYTEDVCKTLMERVTRPNGDEEHCNSHQEVDDIINELSLMIADHICREMNKQLKKFVVNAKTVGKICNHAMGFIKFAKS